MDLHNANNGHAGVEIEHPASQTVEAIISLHQRAEAKVPRHQRAVESASAWMGRPVFLHAVILVIVLWVACNSMAQVIDHAAFDAPPFYWLQFAVGIGAFLTAIIVLITQNRQGRLAERRAQLDLQVSLLTEQKIAKLIGMLEELRQDMPEVENRYDPEAQLMKEPTDPGAVLVALEAGLGDTIDQELREMEETTRAEPED